LFQVQPINGYKSNENLTNQYINQKPTANSTSNLNTNNIITNRNNNINNESLSLNRNESRNGFAVTASIISNPPPISPSVILNDKNRNSLSNSKDESQLYMAKATRLSDYTSPNNLNKSSTQTSIIFHGDSYIKKFNVNRSNGDSDGKLNHKQISILKSF
jgi:hypothetical protein